MPRRRVTSRRINGGGDETILDLLGSNYRLWAALPATVNALMALAPPPAPGEPSGTEKILAVVGRPMFPAGVCQTCGCTDTDPCFYPLGSEYAGGACGWADRDRRQCTVCAGTSPDALEVDPALTSIAQPPSRPRLPRHASRSTKASVSSARPEAPRPRRSH